MSTATSLYKFMTIVYSDNLGIVGTCTIKSREAVAKNYEIRYGAYKPTKLNSEQNDIKQRIIDLPKIGNPNAYMIPAGAGTGKTTTIAKLVTEDVSSNYLILGSTKATVINSKNSIMKACEEGRGMMSHIKSNSQFFGAKRISVCTIARFLQYSKCFGGDADAHLGNMKFAPESIPQDYNHVKNLVIIIDEIQNVRENEYKLVNAIAKMLKRPLICFGDPRQDVWSTTSWLDRVYPRDNFSQMVTTYRFSSEQIARINKLMFNLYGDRYESLRLTGSKQPEMVETEPFMTKEFSPQSIINFIKKYPKTKVGLIFMELGRGDASSLAADAVIKLMRQNNLNFGYVSDGNFKTLGTRFIEVYNCPGHEYDYVFFVNGGKCTPNQLFTAMSRARLGGCIMHYAPDRYVPKIPKLANMDDELFLNNFMIDPEPPTKFVIDSDIELIWNTAMVMEGPTEQLYKLGRASNGGYSGWKPNKEPTLRDLQIQYNTKNIRDFVQTESFEHAEPKALIINGISYTICPNRVTDTSIHTTEAVCMAILEAVAYRKRYAIVYGSETKRCYDLNKMDIDNFMWFVSQIQYIKPLTVSGYFIDTEFNNEYLTEFAAIYPSNISKSIIRRAPGPEDEIKTLIGSPEPLEPIILDDKGYYYLSYRDREAFRPAKPQNALVDPNGDDCRNMIRDLGRPRGIFIEGETMTLQLLYVNVIGICDASKLHGATYDAVLLSELADQWMIEKTIKLC